jgi:hypothetical protein
VRCGGISGSDLHYYQHGEGSMAEPLAVALHTQVLPFFDMPIIETFIGFEMAVYQQVGAAVPAA